MPRPLDVALAEDAVVTEGGLRLASRRLERLVELGWIPDDAHASAAAAGCGLDDEREADLVRLSGRNDRNARLARDALRLELVAARRATPSGGGPTQISSAAFTASAKSGFSARKP